MPFAWKIAAVRTSSGNVISDWLGRNPELQARVDAQLRRMVEMPGIWPMPYYRPLGEGVGEIRVDMRKVEHRMYGYFASRMFVVVLASSDKKTQQRYIKSAKKLKKQYFIAAPELENYDV
jgi:putative component of toxin-antitoxin plasmid stabilization module